MLDRGLTSEVVTVRPQTDEVEPVTSLVDEVKAGSNLRGGGR